MQLASVAGAIPFAGLAANAGSKAGLTNFTETLRIELKHSDIGLTVVSPGQVATEMWDRLDNADRPTVDAVANDRRFVRLPKRYGGYHALSNAPRRLVEGALFGVKFPDERT